MASARLIPDVLGQTIMPKKKKPVSITPPGPGNLPTPTTVRSHGPGSGAPDTAPRFPTVVSHGPGSGAPPTAPRTISPTGPRLLPPTTGGPEPRPRTGGPEPRPTALQMPNVLMNGMTARSPIQTVTSHMSADGYDDPYGTATSGAFDDPVDDTGGPVYVPPPTPAPPSNGIAPGEGDPNSDTPPATRANYSAPRFQGGGVDAGKWVDPNHTTVKYTALRIADQVDPRTLGRPGLLSPLAAQIREQLQAQGFQIVDEDKIYRADVGEIDILHGDRTEWGWRLTGKGNTPAGKTPKGGGGINPPGPKNLPPSAPPAAPRAPIPTTGGALGSGGVAGFNAGAQGSPQIFSDPATQILERVAKFLIDQRMNPLANPELDRYQSDATEQLRQLRAPIYSEQEEAALRTKAFEQLERDRATAKQQTIDQLAAMGHDRSSGSMVEALALVDKRFDQARAQRENELMTGAIDERQRRLQAAMGLSGQAASVRSGEQDRQEGRQDYALRTAAIFPDIAERRLQMAQNGVSGSNAQLGSLFQSISTLLGQNQQQQGNQALMWQGLIDMINQALSPRA